jgi:Xaa-Pro aminopeptidase
VPTYRRQHCGHGIGLSIYEPPVIAPDVDAALEDGMTFCFETPYYELGWGGMMVEDTVVITEDGIEMLCSGRRDLLVVPA